MKLRRVFRWDGDNSLFRLFRVIWETDRPGYPWGVSHKLSVALSPRLFRWRREGDGWFLTLLGVRVHRARSYGGRFD